MNLKLSVATNTVSSDSPMSSFEVNFLIALVLFEAIVHSPILLTLDWTFDASEF